MLNQLMNVKENPHGGGVLLVLLFFTTGVRCANQ